MLHRYLPATIVTIAAAALVVTTQAQTSAPATPLLVGAWTLNKDLSDQPQGQSGDGTDNGNSGNTGSSGGRGGGRRRGGLGGGGFGGGGLGGGTQAANPEAAARLRSALRDEMEPPDHMTITQADALIIITTGDGRTTRLSSDGKKIKDESTNVERKTKWDGGKLVSEINGLGSGKITETYTVDTDHKQLHVALLVDGRQRKTTQNRVYDLDPR